MILRCRGRRRIKILSSFYGRADKDTCNDGSAQTTGCSKEDAEAIVQKKCDGKKRCRLQANKAFFGDPCPNTSKYLAVKYTCVGENGKDRKRRLSGSGCRCTGSGDVHYYDFIKIKSDIQGICKYTFSRSTEEFPYEKCKWNVEVKNERRGTKTSVSYTKMADVTICGEKIRIMKDGVFMVDNLEVSSLAYSIENCGINIRKETRELEIYSEECNIRVLWDGKSRIELDVPKNYSQYAEGICGDCTDGNRFMLRNGTDISTVPKRQRDVLWGQEWEVIDDSGEELEECPVSLPVKECTEEQNKILASDTYCGKINPDRQEGVTPFADCLKSDAKMAKEMFDACIVDVCMNLGGPYEKEALCLAIDAVAQNCRKNDFEYDEWRKPDFCPMTCDEHSTYKFSSKCPATCENKNPTDEDCDLPAVEGCVCDEGYYLDDKKCVLESQCGCIADDNEYYKIGAIRRENDCTLEEQCMPGGEMKENWKNEGCHENGWCVVKKGNYECECKANYRGDGREKCDEIPAACVKNEKVNPRSRRCKRHRKNKRVLVCTIRSAEKIMNVEVISSVKSRKKKANKRNKKGKGKKNKKESKKSKRAKQRRRRRNRRNKCRVVGKLRSNKFLTRGNCRRAIFQVTYLSRAGNCENDCGENAVLRKGKCRCPKGHTGDPKKKCSKMCTCVSAGDPHIRTTDGAMLHVMGVCKYILSALKDTKDPCAYTVETTTEKRNSRPVSYNKRVDFTIGNVVYSILKGSDVMINGQLVPVPQNLDAENIVITREERSIAIRHTKCEIDVSYDGRHKVMVQAPFSTYSGRVTGMCGNCNRDKEDDYMDGDGNLAKPRALHYRLGQKWKSPGESCQDEQPLATCSDKATKEAGKMNKCGLLNSKNGLFKEAFVEGFDLSEYYASCVFDVCENLNLNLHCQMLEYAVKTASQSEIRIDLTEWRIVTNCPLKCDKTFVESDKVTCIPNCMDTEADKSSECATAPYRGCTCESGKVEKDNICVDIAECRACSLDIDTRNYNVFVGDTYPYQSECGNFKQCVDKDGKQALIEKTDVKCTGEKQECRIEGGTRKCMCVEGFEQDIDDSSKCIEKPKQEEEFTLPNEEEPTVSASCKKDIIVECTAKTRKLKSCKVVASDLQRVTDIEPLESSCNNKEYKLRKKKNAVIVKNKCSGKFKVTYSIKGKY
ncbi:zonadhesin-like [Mytilus edulis]|uniref:zonadhesin-like n=1 Tax=Mytilus edulis TaxID=6550 RepID=UPI0039F0EAA7